MHNNHNRFMSAARSSASRGAIIILLASSAAPVAADTAAISAAQDQPNTTNQTIIVTGQAPFRDATPEQELDETGIESYGVSTIDELLGEVQSEVGGDDDQPLILVNGERINDMSEIGALPVEALRSVEVLPRGSAVRLGGKSGQRVVSLTLKSRMKTATVTGARKAATEGDWDGSRGEGIVTYVRGSTRGNLTLRARDESSLLESDRNIRQLDQGPPYYSLEGNIIPYPSLSGEIDPLLTGAAGEIVSIAPVPGAASPGLADFAAGANRPNITDLGEFRSLRPATRGYDLNGTFATRLAPWLTSNATLRWSRNRSRSQRGLPGGLFVLSPDNPYSPFSRDVRLATYGRNPLLSRSLRDSAEGNLTLNGQFGKWTGNFNARHYTSRDVTRTQRAATSGNIPLDDDIDPFGTDLTDLIPLRSDRASTRSTTSLSQLALTGPAIALPAGDVIATVEGRLAWNRLRSSSTYSSAPTDERFRRSEQSIRGALDVPITSRTGDFLGEIGDLSATAELSRIHFSDAGTLRGHAFGLIWQPRPIMRLSGSIEQAGVPAAIQILGNPVVVADDVRMFDPLTGDTVDVTQITGGIPTLGSEKTKTRRVSALLRLVPRLNLQLNSEYTDTDRRNFLSSLPSGSAAIMLAFPDRFIRDRSDCPATDPSCPGKLVSVDLRPVNFDSHREKRLRWGLSMRARLGGGTTALPAATPRSTPRPAARELQTYLQLTANHSIVFSDKIKIRPGLDSVDLLDGGAIGIASGRVRHQIDGTAALNSGGLGARLGVTWRGKSTLETRINGTEDTLRFSPVLAINLRAFADLKRFLPHSNWAKGMRISIDVLNLANDRQKVRDSFGETPLQYQPGYRDPLGRTIEFEIRKVF